jgi:predicted PurR-regulated permease PerM
VLYAVPYLGQIGLLIVCATVAWLAGRSAVQILQVTAALVIIGQIFDQIITTRVIGKQVGLHPVIGLFALMTGAQLFGLAGMVFAVPVAAGVRVVLIEVFPRLTEPLPSPEPQQKPKPDLVKAEPGAGEEDAPLGGAESSA